MKKLVIRKIIFAFFNGINYFHKEYHYGLKQLNGRL